MPSKVGMQQQALVASISPSSRPSLKATCLPFHRHHLYLLQRLLLRPRQPHRGSIITAHLHACLMRWSLRSNRQQWQVGFALHHAAVAVAPLTWTPVAPTRVLCAPSRINRAASIARLCVVSRVGIAHPVQCVPYWMVSLASAFIQELEPTLPHTSPSRWKSQFELHPNSHRKCS